MSKNFYTRSLSSKEFEHFAHFPALYINGSRQVGKTTGVLQLYPQSKTCTYISADENISKSSLWLKEIFLEAAQNHPKGILIVDEIQKVEHWSETVKWFWDQQKFKKEKLKLILLGSSSLQMHSGVSESLAGRFLLHPVYHWEHKESSTAYHLNLEPPLVAIPFTKLVYCPLSA